MFAIIKNKLKQHSTAVRRFLTALIGTLCLCGVIFFTAMHGAAQLFNHAMAEQHMLRGTITVATLSADFTGQVEFTDLLWKDPDGHIILEVPSGSFTVRPWDVITKNITSTSLLNLTLNDATIAAYFDHNMRMDLVLQDPAERQQELEKARREGRSWRDRIRNFNWNGQKLHCSIDLNNCRFESFHKRRHYIMDSVNAHIGIFTGRRIDMKFSTGRFSGNAIGDGIAISGIIDLKPAMPVMDMKMDMVNIDPSSLGLGDDVHDQLTLSFHVQGPLDYPVADGHLKMAQLDLPALFFTDVKGNVHYENSLFTFTDVTASVYGGTLKAYGDYNLATRAYDIYGEGSDLESSIALQDMKFRTRVHLDMALRSNGQPHQVMAYGSFYSDKGYYFPIHFTRIAGRFNNQNRKLDFYDVVISTSLGDIRTDALHIVNGDVKLSTIRMVDPGNGDSLVLHDPARVQQQAETRKQFRENVKNLKKSIQAMRHSLGEIQDSLQSLQGK